MANFLKNTFEIRMKMKCILGRNMDGFFFVPSPWLIHWKDFGTNLEDFGANIWGKGFWTKYEQIWNRIYFYLIYGKTFSKCVPNPYEGEMHIRTEYGRIIIFVPNLWLIRWKHFGANLEDFGANMVAKFETEY